MGCNILDWRCIIVNELVGSAILAVLFAAILYFIVASRLRLGFELTLFLGIPLMFILGMMFAGFSGIMAFMTIIIGLMLAWIFQKVVEVK